jgi:hypothetical protein
MGEGALAMMILSAPPLSGRNDPQQVGPALPYQSAPAVGEASDPHFASVVLLCSFDGVDGATSAIDDSPSGHSLTFAGNAQIDTAQSVFGGAAARFDGSGDRIAIADHADWNFGSGQFTIECFIRYNSAPTGSGNGDKFAAVWAVNNQQWAFGRPDGSASELNFIISTTGVNTITVLTTSGAGLTTNAWYHVAVDRDASNDYRIYVDGVMRGKANNATAIVDQPEGLAIGAESGGGRVIDGWIDEVRITKGVARYASDAGFTPPTQPYPRS